MGKTKQTPGFTLVEVIAGIVLATIALLSITVLINTLLLMNDRARDLTLANALIENKVETLRSRAFAQLTDGTTDFTDDLPESLGSPRDASYTISTSSISSSMKEVTLTLTYTDHGQTRTLNYKTFIGQLGVGG